MFELLLKNNKEYVSDWVFDRAMTKLTNYRPLLSCKDNLVPYRRSLNDNQDMENIVLAPFNSPSNLIAYPRYVLENSSKKRCKRILGCIDIIFPMKVCLSIIITSPLLVFIIMSQYLYNNKDFCSVGICNINIRITNVVLYK